MKLLCFLLIILWSNLFASEEYHDKSTPKLKEKISTLSVSSDTTISIWVTLDETIMQKVPIALSDKSIQRRKRVDATNFLVDEKDSTFSQIDIDAIRNSGAIVRHILYWMNAVSVEIPIANIASLASLPFVKEIDELRKLKSQNLFQVEPHQDSKKSIQKSLALPYGFSQFQTSYIKADILHDIGLSGKGVRIAMFDSGFNTFHSAFDSTHIVNTYNFIDNIVDVTQPDCTGGLKQIRHGTMTLGIVGGYVPDTLIGIAYNAEFLLAKTEITCDGVEIIQEEDNWIAAAQWADQQGADIISSSLGYIDFQDTVGYIFADLDGDTPRITAAADIAAEKNILVINSAGNERNSSWNHIITPSDGDSVIAVGATNKDSSLAGFSSPGPSADRRIKPDISTLGVSIVSALDTAGFTSTAQGTSFSAPLVTGGVALALEHDTTLTADELRDLIRQSGDRYENPDNNFGYGLFDAVKTTNIVSFLKPYSFSIGIGGTNNLLIETSGRSDVIPVISLLDTINGITFQDHNDGTGTLTISPINNSKPVQIVRIIADVGYFADTTEYTILISELLIEKLVVGPNPCSEFLNIYFYDAQNFQTMAIHKVSGEIIWELINDITIDADINRIEARWNCNNQSGEVVADGVYIVVVSAGGEQFYQKVLKIE